MLKNYLRIAVRSLRRQRLYAVVNVVGMAVGLATVLLILLFVRHETSYDDYHEKAGRIYRVSLEQTPEDGSTPVEMSFISPAVGFHLAQEYPQIQSMARLTPVGPLLSRDDTHIVPEHAFWGDPSIFEILSVKVLRGDPVAELDEPFTIALSETLARRLFGSDDPVGQMLRVNDRDEFAVVAIFADLPAETHLHFDAVGSISSMDRWFAGRPMNEVWDSPNYLTYVALQNGISRAELAASMEGFLNLVQGVNVPSKASVRIQDIRDIHLNSSAMMELEPQGSRDTVLLFVAIALFILLIATINFTNLAVAASTRRDREVGIRKAAGASRHQLVGQFVGEATVVTAVAMALALVLVSAALPSFSAFLGKPLSLSDLGSARLLVILFFGSVVIGTLAGSYPAFYLSNLKPSQIFRGRSTSPRRTPFLRSSLIVLQFSIAVALMLATLVVFRQLSYVRSQDLGFDAENVLVLPAIRDIAGDFESFRAELMRNPDILDVAQSNPSIMNRLIPPFDGTAYHEDRTETATIYPVWTDERYFSTFDIPIVAGREFDVERVSDRERGLILNEAAVARFGFPDPTAAIGKEVQYGGARRDVVGVAADFHHESLREPIVPMGFYQDPRNYRAISVRFSTDDFPALVSFLREKWSRYYANRPLEIDFLDQRVAAAYNADQRLGTLFASFSFLGIFVACLGLFGMAAVLVQRRRKEIGIRKVVGAATTRLVATIAMDFVKLALVAALLGGAVGYFVMSRWLENFAYHGAIGPVPVLIVGAITVAAALVAVIYESISAALANPAESLRAD